MTTYLLAYRLTVYAPRSVDFTEATILTPPGGAVHSDPFKVTTLPSLTGWKPYLGLPRGRTGRVNVLERSTDIGTMTFELLDAALVPGINANRWVSAFLGNAQGDPQLGGLKCFAEESLDGGVTWTAFWTGYIKGLALNGRGQYQLTVRDMLYELTKLPLFNQPPHTSITYAGRPLLMPIGITGAAYGTVPPAADFTGTVASPIVIASSTLANVARVDVASTSVAGVATNFITSDLLGAVAPNVRPHIIDPYNPNATLPNFNGPARVHLTWNVGANQGDFKIGMLGQYTDVHGHHALTAFYIQPLDDATDLGYAALPANGTAVTFRMYQDFMATDGFALFLDVANVLTLLADILGGKFSPVYRSPDKLPTGKVYGDVRRSFSTTISAATIPDLPPARFRIEKEVTNALDWIQKNILKPYGLALVVDGAGVFTVIDMRLPTSLGGLPLLTDADLAADPALTWEYDRDAAIFAAEASLWEDLPIMGRDKAGVLPDPYPALKALLLAPIEHPQKLLAIGSGDFGEKVWQMGGGGYRMMEGDAAIAGASRDVYLQRRLVDMMNLMRRPYAFGETKTTLPCRRTATVTAIIQGQVVQVAVSALPDPSTGKRGGTRICRAVEVTRDKLITNLQLLDLGVAAVAGTPTLGAPALGSDPRHTATVAVTVHADGPTEVRYALTASGAGAAPVDADPSWHAYPLNPVRTSSTITLGELTPGLKLWVQARTFPDDRASLKMPSAWVTSTGLVLTGYGVPSVVTVTSITATSAKVSWTNGETTLPVEVWLRSPDSGAYTRIASLLPGSNFFNLWGLVASQAYGVLIQYRVMAGIVSGSATASFSTSSTVPVPITPPPPLRVYI